MGSITDTLEDGILTVTFANPPEGVFTGAMAEDLLALLPAMAADNVLAVILQGGVPGAFIRHYSVAELAALSDALRAKGRTFDEATPVDHHAMNRIAEGLEALPKPAIAALNGTAMAAAGNWRWPATCASPRPATMPTACRRRGSASCPAPAVPSGWPGWSAKPGRWK